MSVRKPLFIAFVVLFCAAALAAPRLHSAMDDRQVNLRGNGIAVAGFDVVSYASAEGPVPGSKAFMVEHDGGKYLFASEGNMRAFAAMPEAFIPAYGGYCAYGVRLGQKLEIDPNVYAIHDGHLYLFLDRATQMTWKEDVHANIRIADDVWPELK